MRTYLDQIGTYFDHFFGTFSKHFFVSMIIKLFLLEVSKRRIWPNFIAKTFEKSPKSKTWFKRSKALPRCFRNIFLNACTIITLNRISKFHIWLVHWKNQFSKNLRLGPSWRLRLTIRIGTSLYATRHSPPAPSRKTRTIHWAGFRCTGKATHSRGNWVIRD